MSWEHRQADKMFGDLIGDIILRAEFPSDTELVLHFFNRKPARFFVEGDCCSSSYFYHMDDFHPRSIGRLRAVQTLKMPDDPDDKDAKSIAEGEVKVYGYEFLGDRGRTTLEFRNSSNGYCGGWMERVPD